MPLLQLAKFGADSKKLAQEVLKIWRQCDQQFGMLLTFECSRI